MCSGYISPNQQSYYKGGSPLPICGVERTGRSIPSPRRHNRDHVCTVQNPLIIICSINQYLIESTKCECIILPTQHKNKPMVMLSIIETVPSFKNGNIRSAQFQTICCVAPMMCYNNDTSIVQCDLRSWPIRVHGTKQQHTTSKTTTGTIL